MMNLAMKQMIRGVKNQDANETIWNYYTNKLKDEWNSAVNALGKSWDLTVNSYKCGWNNLMDFNIAYIEARIFVTEKLTGAKTVNISIAGRVEAEASVNTAVGITYDSAGNIAVQWALNGGGPPGVSAGLDVTGSNASLYTDYAGWSGIVVGSFSPGLSFGYDQIIMSNGYLGSSFSIGSGITLPLTGF